MTERLGVKIITPEDGQIDARRKAYRVRVRQLVIDEEGSPVGLCLEYSTYRHWGVMWFKEGCPMWKGEDDGTD